MTCPVAEPLLGCYADDPQTLTASRRRDLEQHLAACAPCRVRLQEQQEVRRILRARPGGEEPPGFAARLSLRLDAEPQGVLALANWRIWTAALAPLAAALVLVAWSGTAPVTTATSSVSPVPETFAGWTEANAGAGRAAVFMQSATGDLLIESILTGTTAGPGGSAAPGDSADGH